MGYACPVCDDPQADAGHLANHLAFTAIARGGDHEAWLDDNVPDWGDRDEDGLAEAVTPLAEEREYPQLFEDTAGGLEETPDHADHDHAQHGRSPTHPAAVDPGRFGGGDGELDEEARDILETAREMTEQRRDDDSETE
jgi:hypothetical protein